MPYSKRQFVIAAFEEAGLASYVYDLTPDQLNSALQRLDAMIAYWNGRGVRVSYPLPGSPEIATLTRQHVSLIGPIWQLLPIWQSQFRRHMAKRHHRKPF